MLSTHDQDLVVLIVWWYHGSSYAGHRSIQLRDFVGYQLSTLAAVNRLLGRLSHTV